MIYTIEELSIIKLYCGFEQNRDMVLSALQDTLPLITDAELQNTVETIIRKVNAMTKESFANLDLSEALVAESY